MQELQAPVTTVRTRRAGRAHIAFGALALAALALTGGVHLWTGYNSEIEATERSAEKLVHVLKDHIESAFDGAGTVLRAAHYDVDALRQRNSLTGPALQPMLARHISGQRIVKSLWVLDADGHVIGSSETANPPPLNFANVAGFQRLRDTATRDTLVGLPNANPLSGQQGLVVTRRLIGDDGRFAGAIVAGIPADFFADFFRSLKVGPRGLVALFRDDAVFLAREPRDNRVGVALSESPLFREYRELRSGVFHSVSQSDARARINAFQRLETWPLVVTVNVAVEDALADWYDDLRLLGGIWLLMALLITGFTVFLVRKADQQSATADALAASEAHFRTMTANVPAIVYQRVSYPDGRAVYSYVSKGLIDLYGITPEEAVSNPSVMHNAIHPLDRDRVRMTTLASRTALTEWSADFRIVARDGTTKWVRGRSQPRRATGGAIIWDGVVIDTTVEKQAAETAENARDAARQSRAMLTDAIESLRDGFMLFDKDNRLVMINRAGRDWHPDFIAIAVPGVHRSDLLRVAARTGLIDDMKGDIDTAIQARLSKSRSDFGKPFERLIGNRWYTVTEHPTSDGGVVVLRTDITELKRANLALAAAKNTADAANRAKSEFLANMSHEIRTPMNGIIGMNGLLLDSPLADEQRQYATIVRDSAQALMTIINDILDVSKLEAGKVELERIGFDPAAAVEDVMELMAPRSREKRLELGADIDPAARGAFSGDPTRFRQVLFNLVGNAIKFTDKGSVRVDVEHIAASDAGSAVIRVEVVDTGIGIPRDMQAYLFEKFTQADGSITRRFGGTGLGLAIARQLVGLMGGEIGVASEQGKGSRFWFTMPVVPALTGAQEEAAPAKPPGGLRALIVDDAEMTQQILQRQLERAGIHVTCMSDSTAALEEIQRGMERTGRYDIVFLDQVMPGLTGADIATRLRTDERYRSLKIVLISGMGMPEAFNRQPSLCDAVLMKPIRQKSLLECLVKLYSAPEGTARPYVAAVPAGAKPAKRLGRILLAEDHDANRQLATALLEREGYTVHTVGNGVDAVSAVRQGNYHVVLMDVQMPVMDGIEATRQIRALGGDRAEIPIIALTAHAMDSSRSEYLAAGMDDYVSKPFERDDLLITVERWMIGGSATGSADRDAPATGGNPVTEAPVLDESRLAVFANATPPEQFRTVIESYLTGADQLVSNIADSLTAGNLTEAARHAHTLVGTSGNFGAMQLHTLARRLEVACKAKVMDDAATLAHEVRTASERASTAIRLRFLPRVA